MTLEYEAQILAIADLPSELHYWRYRGMTADWRFSSRKNTGVLITYSTVRLAPRCYGSSGTADV